MFYDVLLASLIILAHYASDGLLVIHTVLILHISHSMLKNKAKTVTEGNNCFIHDTTHLSMEEQFLPT